VILRAACFTGEVLVWFSPCAHEKRISAQGAVAINAPDQRAFTKAKTTFERGDETRGRLAMRQQPRPGATSAAPGWRLGAPSARWLRLPFNGIRSHAGTCRSDVPPGPSSAVHPGIEDHIRPSQPIWGHSGRHILTCSGELTSREGSPAVALALHLGGRAPLWGGIAIAFSTAR